MKTIENQTFDMERALYGSRDVEVKNCRFDGPADGESAFKECSNIRADHCFFNLRYPFWHDHGLRITDSEMTELCRAALWYTDHVEIVNTKMHGIKALRECAQAVVKGCDIISPEFGWSVCGIGMEDTTVQRRSDIAAKSTSSLPSQIRTGTRSLNVYMVISGAYSPSNI